jgi:cardiolipin synthase
VVLDGWGSALDGRLVKTALEADGCDVRIFHPLSALVAGRLRRNHRKILLVDGEVAFVGGINVSEEYGAPGPGPAGDEGAPDRDWLDLAVEVRGRAALALEEQLRGGARRTRAGPVRIRLSGAGGARSLRQRYRKAFGAARREIVAAHAYFLPDRRFVRSITAAARRGVRVTLLLAGRSDVPLARAATLRLYRRLLQAGVDIREWTRSVHHAKVAVVDGRRLLLGSFNLDPLSLSNLEVLVEVNDPEVAASGLRWLGERIALSRPVAAEDLVRRPAIVRWAVETVGVAVARSAEWVGRLLSLR